MRDIPTWTLYAVICVAILLAGCATPSARPDIAADHPGISDVPVGEVRLHQLHPDVWVHVSTWRFDDGTVYPSNGLIVRDGVGLLLIDPAWGEAATAALLSAIDAEIGRPVRRAIVTHFHDDRVAGTNVLERRGITVQGTPHTRQLAEKAGNAVPADTFVGLAEVGSVVPVGPVEVFYPGAGHTEDNLVVYVPEAALLYGGCAVHEAARENAGNIEDADLRSWSDAIRRIQVRYPDTVIVVPGHGAPGGAELLNRTIAIVDAHRRGAKGG